MRFKLLCVLMLLFTINSTAQDTFEGVVKYKMVNNGDEMLMNYFTNGKDIKIELQGKEQATMIMKGDKVIMVMPSQKMYMEFPASMLDMVKKMAPQGNDENKKFDSKAFEENRTGETKAIHGYKCEKWLFEDENGTSEVWLTDQLGNFMFMENPFSGGGNSMFTQFDEANYFPVLMVVKDKSSNETSRFEATDIQKMDLEPSEFMAPPGFQKMDMQNMMKQFMEK